MFEPWDDDGGREERAGVVPIEPFRGWIETQIREANERIENCHEVVACPKCQAPRGKRCRRMPLGYGIGMTVGYGRPTVHPHRERWTLVQAPR